MTLDSMPTGLSTKEKLEAMNILWRDLSKKLAGNFPFAIYYLVANELVNVVAVPDCR